MTRRAAALRAGLWIAGLMGVSAVSAGAITVANTVATLPSPRDPELLRLADIQIPNAAAKQDRLDIQLASLSPTDDDVVAETMPATPALSPDKDPPPAADGANTGSPSADRAATAVRSLPAPKPRAVTAKAVKPANEPVLGDAQIAALKQRLRLSPGQEPYWPQIEAALRGVGRQIQEASRRARGAPVAVDTSTPEVERLKSAAMPFLMQMRPDQKTEIVSLARLMGMERMVALL